MIRTLLLLLAGQVGQAADGGATLVDANFGRQTVANVTIDGSSVTTSAGSMPVGELLAVRFAAPATTRPADALTLVLRDGTRLAGSPVSLAQDALVWNGDSVGQQKIPVEAIDRIERAAEGTATQPASATTAASEDEARLNNGDRVAGIVSGATDTQLTLQTADGRQTPVDWSAVRSVRFAATGGAPAAAKPATFHVALVDGSQIDLSDVSLDGNELKATWRGGPIRIDRSRLAAIDNLTGRTRLLAYRAPNKDDYQPYFPRMRPPASDRSPTTMPTLSIRPARPRSTLAWSIEPNQSLHARYAIPSDLPKADVSIRVLADDKAVLERQHVRGGDTGAIDVPLGSATTLTLVVDYGDNLDVQDEFAWLDLALTRPGATP